MGMRRGAFRLEQRCSDVLFCGVTYEEKTNLSNISTANSLRTDSLSQSNLRFYWRKPPLHNLYPYIDCCCFDQGLLEHRIETTSEVVSILIG
jgi:hypothetical protein